MLESGAIDGDMICIFIQVQNSTRVSIHRSISGPLASMCNIKDIARIHRQHAHARIHNTKETQQYCHRQQQK